MNNLNSILIEGNLVRDPEMKTTTKGTNLCTFRMATNRFYKNGAGYEKEIGYFDVETWGRLAEICNSKGKKGRGARIVGRLKQDRWNGNDGKPKSKVSIVADYVEFRQDFKKNKSTDEEVDTVENPEMAESLVPTF